MPKRTALIKVKSNFLLLQHQPRTELLSVLGYEAIELGGGAFGKHTLYLCYRYIELTDGGTHAERASVGVAHASVVVFTAYDVLAADGTGADDLTVLSRIYGRCFFCIAEYPALSKRSFSSKIQSGLTLRLNF